MIDVGDIHPAPKPGAPPDPAPGTPWFARHRPSCNRQLAACTGALPATVAARITRHSKGIGRAGGQRRRRQWSVVNVTASASTRARVSPAMKMSWVSMRVHFVRSGLG